MIRSEKSAEAVVAAGTGRRAERVGEPIDRVARKCKASEARATGAQVPGLCLLGQPGWSDPVRGGEEGGADLPSANPLDDAPLEWTKPRRGGGTTADVCAGWKAYFQLAQTPGVFLKLDEWLRHRLRALQLKHWRRGTTMYRELVAMGASKEDARRIAANSRRWWRNSRFALNRPVRTRMPGGVGGDRSGNLTAPIPISRHPGAGRLGCSTRERRPVRRTGSREGRRGSGRARRLLTKTLSSPRIEGFSAVARLSFGARAVSGRSVLRVALD